MVVSVNPGRNSVVENEEESSREERGEEARPPRRGINSSAPLEELMGQLLAEGAAAEPRLRGHLAGNIRIEISDKRKQFEFPWGVQGAEVDCTIKLTENSLRRILDGELNPQIGMLSDKIKVKGRAELAMYFFNIIE